MDLQKSMVNSFQFLMHAKTPDQPSRWTNSFELLRQLVIREIAESVKGSALGILWLVFSPLLSMALYVVVFGVLFGGAIEAMYVFEDHDEENERSVRGSAIR